MIKFYYFQLFLIFQRAQSVINKIIVLIKILKLTRIMRITI